MKFLRSPSALISFALLFTLPAIALEKATFAPESIKAQISYLASDELRGRGSGEPGNEKAAQFVAKEFAKAGLKPLGTSQQRDTGAKANGSGYFQPFTFIAGRAVGKNNTLQVDLDSEKKTYRVGVDFEPSSISGSGSAEGALIFAGYGIQAPKLKHDDFAEQGGEKGIFKGRIVLVLAGSPGNDPHSPLADYAETRRKALTVRELGATALLIVTPKEVGLPKQNYSDVSDAGIPVLRVSSQMVEAWFKAKGDDFPQSVKDADAGQNVTEPVGASVSITADVKRIEKVSANIIGMVEGTDPTLKKEYVVIGAHVDHLGMGSSNSLDTSGKPAIHHGADDNASGAAGVMQLAAWFAKSANRPRRSLIFMCFSGEELGLLGSDYYANHPIIPLSQTVAMLNMDMIGRLRKNQLIISGSGTADEWNAILDDINLRQKFDIAKSESGFGASDHQSFYVKNLPVLFFFTGLHDDYHKPSDTADKINAEGEARVLIFVAECVSQTANANYKPTFHRVAQPDPNSVARGFRVYFGSVPNYAFTGEGVLLDGVREGSPAEKAGLKTGDIILKFGDKTVKNVQDYSYALTDYKPGDKVELTVKRGEQTLTLTATLAARKE